MAQESRNFKVQGRVTETIINKLEQLKLVNPEMNESYMVNKALENLFVNRENRGNIENLVFESSVKRTLLRLEALRNRVNMRRSGVDLGVLTEIITLNLRENPKLDGIERDIQELAVLIHEINAYSQVYYKMCLKTARNLLRKRQLTVFDEKLESCIHGYRVSLLIGGTLDSGTDEQTVLDMVSNILTVPKKYRDQKVSDTLHLITQTYEDSHDLCEMFLNALERAEIKKDEENP